MRRSSRRSPVSPEPYFKNEDFDEVQLSPSGKALAALAPVNGRKALVAMDIQTRKPRVITTIDGMTSQSPVGQDNRLVFSGATCNRAWVSTRRGLFGIGRRRHELRILAPTVKSLIDRGQFVYRYTRFSRVLYDGSDDVLVLSNDRSELWADLYRLNTRDGRKTLLTDSWPGDPVRWVADRKGIVRGAMTTEKAGLINRSWWRPSADAKWQLIGEYGLRDASVVPVAFDGDGSLIVGSDIGRETVALYRFDTAKMAVGELLAAHPHTDLTSVIYDRHQSKVVGVYHDGGRPGIAWFDDGWARLASTVDRALPNHFTGSRAARRTGCS